MQIIISPAKKMRQDIDTLAPKGLPVFLEQTQQLYRVLLEMSPQQLQKMWKCNDSIASLNVERLQKMDLCQHLTPAILSYEGIQYQYMAPNVFELAHLDYVQEHLRILSGFYGLLRPFDGVTPYRLEMQARLQVGEHRDLYHFWGSRLADRLAQESDVVVNLASREYSRTVEPHLPKRVRFVTCTFGEWSGEKIQEKGTMCKMARGQMVRWMAEHQVEQPEELHSFQELGYQFSPAHSDETHYVFLKDKKLESMA